MMDRRRALMAAAGGGYEHGTWEDLFYHIDKGDYSTAYTSGEEIELVIDGIATIHMIVSDFDFDVLAEDTTKKAPVTLVAKELTPELYRYNPPINPSTAPYDVGTGSVGGWPASEIRNVITTAIYSKFPEAVRKRIVPVSKYSRGYNENGSAQNNIISVDTVFVPSKKEAFGDTESGRAGQYTALNTATKRQKLRIGKTGTSDANGGWWLRSANAVKGCYYTRWNGAYNNVNVTSPFALCICFCVG